MATRIKFSRGATVLFQTTFFDQNGVVVQPLAANLSVSYPSPAGNYVSVLIAMVTPMAPAVAWTATWDSRGAAPGIAYASVHSEPPLPVAVEDFQFELRANQANLVTFN